MQWTRYHIELLYWLGHRMTVDHHRHRLDTIDLSGADLSRANLPGDMRDATFVGQLVQGRHVRCNLCRANCAGQTCAMPTCSNAN